MRLKPTVITLPRKQTARHGAAKEAKWETVSELHSAHPLNDTATRKRKKSQTQRTGHQRLQLVGELDSRKGVVTNCNSTAERIDS